jgi:hypothetical protein
MYIQYACRYGNTDYGVSSSRIMNWKDFCLKKSMWKMWTTKRYSPKLSLKKRNIPMIIDPENWFLKSNFGTFWYIPTTPILKIQWFPVGMYIFMEKKSSFVSPDLKLHNQHYHTSRPNHGGLTWKFSCLFDSSVKNCQNVLSWF